MMSKDWLWLYSAVVMVTKSRLIGTFFKSRKLIDTNHSLIYYS